jgi:hypothetical protein
VQTHERETFDKEGNVNLTATCKILLIQLQLTQLYRDAELYFTSPIIQFEALFRQRSRVRFSMRSLIFFSLPNPDPNPGYRSGDPGSNPGTTRKKVVGLEQGPLSLVSTTEELFDRKLAAPV